MKLFAAAALSSALALMGCAQDKAALDPAHGQLIFNHMALSVRDVDRSAEFYGQTLNLPEISKAIRSNGVRWFSLGQGTELHLIGRAFFPGEPVSINKAVHLAMATDRFDDIVKQFDSRGIAYSDWAGTPGKIQQRDDGVRQVFFQDPDGYWLELNSVGTK